MEIQSVHCVVLSLCCQVHVCNWRPRIVLMRKICLGWFNVSILICGSILICLKVLVCVVDQFCSCAVIYFDSTTLELYALGVWITGLVLGVGRHQYCKSSEPSLGSANAVEQCFCVTLLLMCII